MVNGRAWIKIGDLLPEPTLELLRYAVLGEETKVAFCCHSPYPGPSCMLRAPKGVGGVTDAVLCRVSKKCNRRTIYLIFSPI